MKLKDKIQELGGEMSYSYKRENVILLEVLNEIEVEVDSINSKIEDIASKLSELIDKLNK